MHTQKIVRAGVVAASSEGEATPPPLDAKTVRETLTKSLGQVGGSGVWSASQLRALADGNNPQSGVVYVVVATNPGNKTLTPQLASALVDAANLGFDQNGVRARAVIVKDVDLDKLPRDAAVVVLGDNDASRAWATKKSGSTHTPGGAILAEGIDNVTQHTASGPEQLGNAKNPNNSARVYPWESRAIGGFASVSVENVITTLGLVHNEFKKPFSQWSASQRELFTLLVAQVMNHEVGHTAGNDHTVAAYEVTSSSGAKRTVVVPADHFDHKNVRADNPSASEVRLSRIDGTGVMEDGARTGDVLRNTLWNSGSGTFEQNCRRAIDQLRGEFYEERDAAGADLSNPDYTARMNALYPAPSNPREQQARALVSTVIQSLEVQGDQVVASLGVDEALAAVARLSTTDAQIVAVRDLRHLAQTLRSEYGAEALATRLETFAETTFRLPMIISPEALGLDDQRPLSAEQNAMRLPTGGGVGIRRRR